MLQERLKKLRAAHILRLYAARSDFTDAALQVVRSPLCRLLLPILAAAPHEGSWSRHCCRTVQAKNVEALTNYVQQNRRAYVQPGACSHHVTSAATSRHDRCVSWRNANACTATPTDDDPGLERVDVFLPAAQSGVWHSADFILVLAYQQWSHCTSASTLRLIVIIALSPIGEAERSSCAARQAVGGRAGRHRSTGGRLPA